MYINGIINKSTLNVGFSMPFKHKHTLKKKIRKTIAICILISLLLFGLMLTYMTAEVSKSQASIITQYYSYFIGNEMNSDFFLKLMNIKGLEEFNMFSPQASAWLYSLRKSNGMLSLGGNSSNDPNITKNQAKSIMDMAHKTGEDTIPGFTFIKPELITSVKIVLNNIELYKSANWVEDNSPQSNKSNFLSSLLNYNRESRYSLFDSKGKEIGYVTAKIDQEYILTMFYSMVATIIFVGILCLIGTNIMAKFFTRSITKPLQQLNEKIIDIAKCDYESTKNAQIIMKKPLYEIEQLADSTNKIMLKMKEYNDTLESQKMMLENQNDELEAQNEELTESKQQIRDAQSQLVQTENMASIGQLTAAITHEINTPLGAINSNVQLFSMLIKLLEENENIKADEEIMGLIAQLKETNDVNVMACERVIQIIRSLKNFTKLDQAEFQESDLNESIRSVLVLTSNLWKRKIKIHEDYGSLPPVKCFSGLLNQVFMNIIVNAIQSIENNGEIYIKTYIDEKNAYVCIRDTGCGISTENLNRIFDAGFSTKAAGTGAGLGLSISSNIIRKHKGEIIVKSELGVGTEFIVSIPLDIYNSLVTEETEEEQRESEE